MERTQNLYLLDLELSILSGTGTASGDLYLSGCTGLTLLLKSLKKVDRNLDLSNCTDLTSLSENLKVGRNLNLSGCTGLTSLPENLEVGGYLNLSGCTGLASLPENLEVGWWLDLSGCTGLTSLPENLHVPGDLNLSGCTGLASLPENLEGSITLPNGTRYDNFESLKKAEPKWFSSYKPHIENGKVDVANNLTVDNLYNYIDNFQSEDSVCSYSRLWAQLVRDHRPELWRRGVELMRQTPVWAEVEAEAAKTPEANTSEDRIGPEVFSRLSGRRGADYFQDANQSEDSKARGLADNVRGWMRQAFSWVKKTFAPWSAGEVENISLDEFLSMPVRDLLEGREGAVNRRLARLLSGESRQGFGAHRRRDYSAKLRKARRGISEDEIRVDMDELEKMSEDKNGVKMVKIAFRWLCKGTIRLPEDSYKVYDAIAGAETVHADLMQFDSPGDFFERYPMNSLKLPPLDPDTVPTLTGKRDIGHGITVYDVADSDESRRNMRRIINTHFGPDSSPWCILQGDGKGNLTKESAEYWKSYSGYPKMVAFQDGHLLAFSANHVQKHIWWDRKDSSYDGIPIDIPLENDSLGRRYKGQINPDTGEINRKVYSLLYRGQKGKLNGTYEEWTADGRKTYEVHTDSEGYETSKTFVYNRSGALLHYSDEKRNLYFPDGKPKRIADREYRTNTEYYRDGSIKSSRMIEDGLIIYISSYSKHQGGGMKTNMKYSRWDNNSNRPAVITFLYSCYPDGSVHRSVFSDKEGTMRDVTYYKNGTLKSDSLIRGDAVNDDNSRYLKTDRYYENGQLKCHMEFNPDLQIDFPGSFRKPGVLSYATTVSRYYPDGSPEYEFVVHPDVLEGLQTEEKQVDVPEGQHAATAVYYSPEGKVLRKDYFDVNRKNPEYQQRPTLFVSESRSFSPVDGSVHRYENYRPKSSVSYNATEIKTDSNGIVRKRFLHSGEHYGLLTFFDEKGRMLRTVNDNFTYAIITTYDPETGRPVRKFRKGYMFGSHNKLHKTSWSDIRFDGSGMPISRRSWHRNDCLNGKPNNGVRTEIYQAAGQEVSHPDVRSSSAPVASFDPALSALDFIAKDTSLESYIYIISKTFGVTLLRTDRGYTLSGLDRDAIEKIPEEYRQAFADDLFGDGKKPGLISSVGGDLSLNGLPVRSLPEGFHVLGNLDIEGTRLNRLPDGLCVEGNLAVRDPSIRAVGENTWVGGDFNVTAESSRLMTVGNNLYVENNFCVNDSLISELPDRMFVGRDLVLSKTPLLAWPEGVYVRHGITLEGCGDIKFPGGMNVRGGLTIKDSLLSSLPENLQINGNLKISGCHQLTGLPESLQIHEGGLICNNCYRLEVIPDFSQSDIHNLNLNRTGIKQLPENLHFQGILDLSCTDIHSLPDNLNLENRDIILRGTHMATLPRNLKVRSIDLNGSDIKVLPTDMEAEEIIFPSGHKFEIYDNDTNTKTAECDTRESYSCAEPPVGENITIYGEDSSAIIKALNEHNYLFVSSFTHSKNVEKESLKDPVAKRLRPRRGARANNAGQVPDFLSGPDKEPSEKTDTAREFYLKLSRAQNDVAQDRNLSLI